jgi:signal transduction histidine kinase
VLAAPTRHRILFALTLALPAAGTAAWAWLAHGGPIANALANERATADQALAFAARTLHERLRDAAATTAVQLPLRSDRTLQPAPTSPATTPTPVGIAEQAAGARAHRGDPTAALPFYRHAAARGELSPAGWLAFANTLAATDPAAARATLREARNHHPDARCGGLPLPWLADLRELAWTPADPDRTELRQRLVVGLASVPVAAFAAAHASLVAALPELATDERILAWQAASTLQLEPTTPSTVWTDAPTAGPFGSMLQPLADHLAVLPAPRVGIVRDAAIAATTATFPAVRIESTDAPGGAPALPLPALGTTWIAVPAGTPNSALLTMAARATLGLAALAFVLGNLLLWRLTRRELQLARLRTEFVDVVSHELRTPLTALSLKAEMLAAGDVPPARTAHYLRGLHADVRRLADQVERILDFGRLQRSPLPHKQPVPARTLLARGLRSGRQALRLVRQQLAVQAPRELPNVTADVDVLGRALRNLLENAAKYAPPGSTVAVRAFATNGELVVEVADQGPGVPAAERRSIFQPFVRGSTAGPDTPGSGLGLALVAAAARTHDGRIDVANRPGGGAVFTLRLPITREDAS